MTTTFKKIDDNKFSIQFVTSQFTSASYIHSQKNEFGGFNWSLVTCTATDADKKQNLSIFLRCEGNKSNLWSVDVNASLSLKHHSEVFGETQNFQSNYKESTAYGVKQFIEIPLLASQGYIKDGQITIECTFTINSTGGVQQEKKHNFEIKDPVLGDAVLIVDGKYLYANKGFLSTHSSVFKSLFFSNNSAFGNTNEQTISDVKYDDFEQFLQCIYKPQNVDKTNVGSVLQLADRFAVHALLDKCESVLISNTDINKLTKLKYAETYKLPNLQIAVLNSIETDTEIKALATDTDDLGDATIRALFKKLGKIKI